MQFSSVSPARGDFLEVLAAVQSTHYIFPPVFFLFTPAILTWLKLRLANAGVWTALTMQAPYNARHV